MAITKQAGAVKLVMRLQTGVDGKGVPELSTRTYSKVKPTVTDQELYDVAQAIADLSAYPLYRVNRVDDAALIEQL